MSTYNRVTDRRMDKKKVFKFTFNYKGEIHEIYTHGVGENVAFGQATFRLAQKLDTTGYALRNYFKGKPNSYSVIQVYRDLKDKTRC